MNLLTKDVPEEALESLQEGIIVLDSEGTIILVNRSIEKLTGVERNNLDGHSVDEVKNPLIRALIPHVKQAQRGFNRVLVDCERVVFDDGDAQYFSFSVDPMKRNDSNKVVVTIRNVTPEKLANDSMRHSLDRLQKFCNGFHLLLLDAFNQRIDLQNVLQRMLEYIIRSLDYYAGFLLLRAGEDEEPQLSVIQDASSQLVQGGNPDELLSVLMTLWNDSEGAHMHLDEDDFELLSLIPDKASKRKYGKGVLFAVQGDAGVIGFLLVVDRSEKARHPVEFELIEMTASATTGVIHASRRNDLFIKTFNAVPEPSFLWRRCDGQMVLRGVNMTALISTGGRLERYLDKPICDIFPGMPEIENALRETIQTGTVVRGEMSHQSEDLGLNGRFIWQFARPMEDTALMILTDITNLRRAESQIRRQREELSTIGHDMAHDLRNVLHNMEGYTQLLTHDYNLDYVEGISRLISKISSLLEEWKQLADAGLAIGNTETCSLTEVVRSAARLVLPDNVELVVGSLPEVKCDPDKVQQVVMNIVSNAVEHGHASRIEIASQSVSDSWDILFKNDGRSIPAEHRKRILSRQFSTKKGGGRGMNIVKKIVEAHGWSIILLDDDETVFRVRIPFE